MGRILTIAKEHRLRVIEDSCQAVGAAYHGQKVGSIGDVGCFSFDAQKAMFTGQGGMFVTSQKSLYTIAHLTRETGQLHDEVGSDVVTTGNTYALTEMQAALARSILAQLDALNSWRRRNYELFTTIMDSSGLPIRWYRILPDVTPSFSRLVFMVDFKKLNVLRDSFIQDMRSEGVPLKTFYPVPLYSYSLFRKRKDAFMKSRFPFSANTSVRYNNVVLAYTEQFCQQQVGMEFSPYMSERHIRYMCKTLRQYLLAHRI
jgi:dTDP-4-amino-4,6-dideoxygalactose transaminase